jgi:hypothetical protein
MNALQQTIALIANALVATAVLGAVVRRRYRLWWFFTLYLATILVVEASILIAPRTFHTPEFWQAKETVIAGLRLAMAAEVGIRTMRAFPGALGTARFIVFAVLVVTLIAVATAPPSSQFRTFVGELQPRVLHGSVWMLTAIAGVILWYRLPVHPFHKAILLSYLPYVLVFSILLSYLGRAGWEPGSASQYVNQLAYVALVAYWNYVIWRRDPKPAADRGAGGPPSGGPPAPTGPA